MRIATLHLSDARGNWIEVYKEGRGSGSFQVGDDIPTWAKGLIDNFNSTRRQNEGERTLVDIEVEEVPDEEPIIEDEEDEE